MARAAHGRPLAPRESSLFEQRFGTGFGHVRVHHDEAASDLARRVDAKAFTVGSHIFFDRGRYEPRTPLGRGLLAHELAHVALGHTADGRFHRQDPKEADVAFDEDQISGEEKFIRLQVFTTGMDAGAMVLANGLARKDTKKNVFIGLHPKFLKVYGNDGKALGPKLNLKEVKGLVWNPGIYLVAKDGRVTAVTQSTKDPKKLGVEGDASRLGQRPYTDAEKKEIAEEEKKAELEGRAAKPPPKIVLHLPSLVTDPARYQSLVESVPDRVVWFFVPTYDVSGGKEGKEGGVKNLYASPIEGRGDGKPANAPGWPVTVDGPKLAPIDSNPTYSAKIDWSANGNNTINAMAMNQIGQSIHYKWELFDITEHAEKQLKKDPANTANDPANKPEKTLDERIKDFERSQAGTGKDVTGMGGANREFTREFEDWWKDTKRAAKGARDPRGDTVRERFSNSLANRVALELAPVSLLVTAIGAVVRWFADLFSGPRQQQEVPLKTKGVYLIRVITTPAITEDRDGTETIRPPSVHAKLVEVTTMDKAVTESLDEPGAQLAELQAQIDLAEKAGDKSRANYLRSLLAEAKLRFEGTPLSLLETQREKKQKELEEYRKNFKGLSDYTRARAVEMIDDQIALYKRHAKQVTGGALKRVNGTLISEVTAEQYPLLLSAGPMAMEDGKHRWLISDVTNRDGDAFIGRGDTPSAAFRSALEKFGGKAAYGRGTIGVRTAGLGLEDGADATMMVESAPADWALAEKRIDDLVMTLAVLGLVVASAGTAGALIGAGVAAARLIERWQAGKLYLDAQTVSDLLGVLGGLGVSLQLGATLRVQKFEKAFAIADTAKLDAAAVAKASEALKGAQQLAKGVELANEIINYGGLLWGDIAFIDQIMSINDQERSGAISKAAARRQRATAISNAVQNNGIFIAGNVLKAKAQAKAAEGTPGKPTTTPREGTTEGTTPKEPAPKEPAPKDTPEGTTPKERLPAPDEGTPTKPPAKKPAPDEAESKKDPADKPVEKTPQATEPVPIGERRATPEELKAALPADLQGFFTLDKALKGDDVRVDYTVDKATGLIADIQVRVGPDARPATVKLHVETVRTMQKYQGFGGRVRLALNWVADIVGIKPDTPNPEHKASFEAALEIQKLPKLIEAQMARMKAMEPNARDLAEAELASLEVQLEKHLRTLDIGPEGGGAGFVAGKGLSKAKQKEYAKLLEQLREHKAGSPEHKKIRREMYELIGGDLPYPQWENVYKANVDKANKANEIVKQEAQRLKWGSVEDTTEQTVKTGKDEVRRLDIADVPKKKGIEVKAYEQGKVYASDEILQEVRRDGKLVKPGGWEITWLFIDCEPSGPLRTALAEAGITIEIRTRKNVPVETVQIIPPPAPKKKTPVKG